MNSADILKIEFERKQLLEKYGLDEESIKTFRKKISNISEEESQQLGQELFELISKKGYSEEDDLDKVIELIYKGANIEYKNEKKGDYSLLVCSRKNYLKTFIVLLKAGANVNQINNYLTTPTMASARHGNKEILELLILMKADVNARCLDGDNAVMSAKRHNQIECFKMLMDAHAYLNNRNLINQTVLDIDSKSDFGILSLSHSLRQEVPEEITFEDAESLLYEASKKMESINGAVLLQSEFQPKTLKK